VAESSRYVLITPARDEAATIGQVIAAVRAQAVTPVRWIIVDDASVDTTAEVVAQHIADVDWIRLVRHDAGASADFASKVHAFRAGVRHLDGVDYDFIGNLDADVLIGPDYFAQVLRVFQGRPRLGIAGGHLVEEYGGRRVPQRISANSVAGAVQLFRRQAFEDTGGPRPVRHGGEDSVAEILARMHSWEVATLFDIKVRHQGQALSLSRGPLAAWFTRGVQNRSLGYAPFFQAAVSVYRGAVQSPYGLTGAAMFAGYVWAAARRVPPALDAEAVAFLRGEQRRRLLGMIGIRRGVG
jgi:poly-beta-1,6-N-acetyl-D-glucosamine synthase